MPPSRVWSYFTRSDDKTSASCNLCKQTFVYKGTTSNLLNHLNGQHPSASSKDEKKQPTVSAFFNSPQKRKVDSEKITQLIADMIVSDYVPLSIVEGTGFRNLLNALAPDYTVPCRKTVRSRVELRYEGEKKKLETQLANVTAAAITTDTWTSNVTESYITVTEHHINEEWELESNVLLTRAMPERHTGENLAARLKESVEEFQLGGKVGVCVHDNARNMMSAGKLCEWEDFSYNMLSENNNKQY